MSSFRVGELTITPRFNNPTKKVNPAIGVVDDVAYVGVWLPSEIIKEDGNRKQQEMLYFVTDKKEVILANNDAFRDTGKEWMLSHRPIQFDNRWNIADIEQFCQDATVNPIELFDQIYTIFKKFIEFTNEKEYAYQTIWSIATYFYHLFYSFPYNYFGGIKRAGKTKCQDVHQKLDFNAIHSSNMSPASIYRLIQSARATILIDETEHLSSRGKLSERGYELRSILLEGYKQSGVVYRVEKGTKDRQITTPFEVYCPKSLANIKGLEDIIDDRCKTTILKRSKDKNVVNTVIDNLTEKDWEKIRNKLYIFYLLYWKNIKEIYNKVNTITDVKQLFSACSVCSVDKSQKCILEGIDLVVGRQLELWKPILVFCKFFDTQGFSKISTLPTLNTLFNNKNDENQKECALSSTLPTLTSTLFYQMVLYAIEDCKVKKVENEAEVGEIIVVQCLLNLVTKDDYYSVSSIKNEMQTKYDEEQKWITPRWVASALRRLGFKDKRRVSKGSEYLIKKSVLKDLALRLEIEIPENFDKNDPAKPTLEDYKVCFDCGVTLNRNETYTGLDGKVRCRECNAKFVGLSQ